MVLHFHVLYVFVILVPLALDGVVTIIIHPQLKLQIDPSPSSPIFPSLCIECVCTGGICFYMVNIVVCVSGGSIAPCILVFLCLNMTTSALHHL